jgi:peptidoglycan/xylan/chitin deacetylase (PgdA/CDA1 family)
MKPGDPARAAIGDFRHATSRFALARRRALPLRFHARQSARSAAWKRGTRQAVFLVVFLAAPLLAANRPPQTAAPPPDESSATVLAYHRFGPVALGATTVKTSVFERQLQFLRDNGYTVVPLRDIVNFVMGRGPLPSRAVAITADDGHRTVFTEMKPVVLRYRIPVTLFIYPSAISNAPYAMTWQQLKDLQATGLFDIQSHTYWHPNFRVEKRRLSPGDYQKLVETQLVKSREVLERRLGSKVDLLAWPFGIYDDELIAAARKDGYIAAFSIERHKVSRKDNVMAIPRFTVSDSDIGKAFEALLAGTPPGKPSSRGRPRD